MTSRARHLRHNRRSLNRHYIVFGEVVRGMEVVDKIVAAPPATTVTIPWNRLTVRMTVKE